MAADDETVERHAIAANFGTIGELLKQGGATLRTAELDVLHEENAPVYWERDESHDLVVSLNHGQPALEALCRVLEAWVGAFRGLGARIQVEKDHRRRELGLARRPGRPGQRRPERPVPGPRRERRANGRACCACSAWGSTSPR